MRESDKGKGWLPRGLRRRVYPSFVWYFNHRLDTTANRGVEAVSRLRKFDDRVFIFANDRSVPSFPLFVFAPSHPLNAFEDP